MNKNKNKINLDDDKFLKRNSVVCFYKASDGKIYEKAANFDELLKLKTKKARKRRIENFLNYLFETMLRRVMYDKKLLNRKEMKSCDKLDKDQREEIKAVLKINK